MNWFLVFVILLLLVYFAVKWRLSPPTRWCRSNRCLLGKTTLITGSNTGIGLHTALDFAKRGAKVILACRSLEKAEEARRKIIEETDNKNIFVKIVDFSSFRSVRSFAQELHESEDRLDILVNNVGSIFGYNEKTEDGYDSIMQVNYYSHFLLTVLLLGLMKKSGEPGRVVNTSSLAALHAKFDVNDVDKYTGNLINYANSKLCNILFTKELAKRLEGSNITTYSLHPGAIKTDIFKFARGFAKRTIDLIVNIFYKPVEDGAQTTIYCSVEKGIEKYSGHHFDNCRRVEDYETAKEPGLPRKLWEATEEIVKLTKEEKQQFELYFF